MISRFDINKSINSSNHFEFTDSSNGRYKSPQCPSAKSSTMDSVIFHSLSEILMSMFASRMVYYHSDPISRDSIGSFIIPDTSFDGLSTSSHDSSQESIEEEESKSE